MPFSILLEGRLDGYVLVDGREERDHHHDAPTWLGAILALSGNEARVSIRARRAQPRRRRSPRTGSATLLFATPPAFQKVMRAFRPVFGALRGEPSSSARSSPRSARCRRASRTSSTTRRRPRKRTRDGARRRARRARRARSADVRRRRRRARRTPSGSSRLQREALGARATATRARRARRRRRRGRDRRAARGARRAGRVALAEPLAAAGLDARVARPRSAPPPAPRPRPPCAGSRRR